MWRKRLLRTIHIGLCCILQLVGVIVIVSLWFLHATRIDRPLCSMSCWLKKLTWRSPAHCTTVFARLSHRWLSRRTAHNHSGPSCAAPLCGLFDRLTSAAGFLLIWFVRFLRAIEVDPAISEYARLSLLVSHQGIKRSARIFARLLYHREVYKHAAEAARLLTIRLFRYTTVPWSIRRYYRLRGYTVIRVCVGRIGHTAGELDGFVKEHINRNQSVPKAMILAPRNMFGVNPDLIRLFAQHVRMIDSPFLCNILSGWVPINKLPYGFGDLGGVPAYNVFHYFCNAASYAEYPKILDDY